MNDKDINLKCEDCGSLENLFRTTILSPCREHSHTEIYCYQHMANIIRDLYENIDLVEKIW